jgi:hypothetical protein
LVCCTKKNLGSLPKTAIYLNTITTKRLPGSRYENLDHLRSSLYKIYCRA